VESGALNPIKKLPIFTQKEKAAFATCFAILYPFTLGTLLLFYIHLDMDGFFAMLLFTVVPVYPVLFWMWLSNRKKWEVFLFGATRDIWPLFLIAGAIVHCAGYTMLMLMLVMLYTFYIGCALGYGCH
jgi:hypothetical protein